MRGEKSKAKIVWKIMFKASQNLLKIVDTFNKIVLA